MHTKALLLKTKFNCTSHRQEQHPENKYDVLTEISTHTYNNKCAYLPKQVRRTHLCTYILFCSSSNHIGQLLNLAWLTYMKKVSVSLKCDTLTLLIQTFAKKVLSFIKHEDYSLIMLNSSSAAARGPSLVFSGIASDV